MIWITIFAFLYLVGTSLVLTRNHFEFIGLQDIKASSSSETPLVSICIPARNEADTIERCVTTALKQEYPNFEVLVLDDHSTDGTSEVLDELSGIINNLRHLKGAPKPDDWLGKPWACHQLSKQAQGEILVFIDADVWLEPDVLNKTVAELERKDAITIWPEQKLGSFWEQLVIPTIYYSLYTLLPAVYLERPPRWMPRYFQKLMNPKFAAACGQFFAFNISTYDAIGGHTSVKDHVVEDVQLSRNIKAEGLQMKMLHGRRTVYCRMYHDHSEVWNGFKKNFLNGFDNMFEFSFMWLIHIVVYLIPIYTAITSWSSSPGLLFYLSATVVLIPIIQRVYLASKFRWNPVYSLLHFLSVIWFQILALVSVINKLTGVKNTWKGREV